MTCCTFYEHPASRRSYRLFPIPSAQPLWNATRDQFDKTQSILGRNHSDSLDSPVVVASTFQKPQVLPQLPVRLFAGHGLVMLRDLRLRQQVIVNCDFSDRTLEPALHIDCTND